jgi:hypothetical protein
MTDIVVWLERFPLATFVRDSRSVWGYPMFLFVHTLGMSIVAGGGAVVALALLGCWPSTSMKPLARLWPLVWLGFGINAFTGLGLLLADLTVKGASPVFWVKMAFVAGGLVLLTRIRSVILGTPDADGSAPPRARFLAWASLACWFGATVMGRLLAYVATGR